MSTKPTSLKRITALYVILFVILGIGILSMADFASNFLKASYSDAVIVRSSETEGKWADILYDIPVTHEGLSFDEHVYEAGGVSVSSRPSALDIKVTTTGDNRLEGLGGAMFFIIISGLLYIATFVLIFMMVTSLRGSVRQGGLMKRSIVSRTRVIAALLICASLSSSLSRYLENRAVADFLAGSGFSISVNFPLDLLQTGTGIVVFMIAEVFAIGYKLSEEQRLTI